MIWHFIEEYALFQANFHIHWLDTDWLHDLHTGIYWFTYLFSFSRLVGPSDWIFVQMESLSTTPRVKFCPKPMSVVQNPDTRTWSISTFIRFQDVQVLGKLRAAARRWSEPTIFCLSAHLCAEEADGPGRWRPISCHRALLDASLMPMPRLTHVQHSNIGTRRLSGIFQGLELLSSPPLRPQLKVNLRETMSGPWWHKNSEWNVVGVLEISIEYACWMDNDD